MNLLSVFGGGLWIIPLGLFLGSAWSFYRAYKSHNSNSTIETYQGKQDNTGNVPYWQIGSFVYGVVLLVACIVVIFLMISDK